MHLVDWSEPSLNVLLAKGVLGEVRREGKAFSAEFRSLAHRLNEECGRLYTATCSADLGDARCTIDLTNPASAAAARSRRSPAPRPFTPRAWMHSPMGGSPEASSVHGGANAGFAVEVKTHRVALDGVLIELWQRAGEPLALGDAFTVTAGCDKRFATCRDRFANARQLPRLPAHPGQRLRDRVSGAGEER